MAGIHNVLAGAGQQPFTYTIATNQTNLNLRTGALAAGWNGSSRLNAVINAGVYISGTSTGTPALTVSGAFPSGVTLTNNGFIVGMGGAGGNGGGINSDGSYNVSTAGGAGGLALSVSSAITINNTSGTIGGGGGGGGGGGAVYYEAGGGKDPITSYNYGGAGGGGGQTGTTNSAGGSGGVANYPANYQFPGDAGNEGTSLTGGAAGFQGVTGGDGGSWGTAGQDALPVSGYDISTPASVGGPAGGAITGNSNITWNNFGTRLGNIT